MEQKQQPCREKQALTPLVPLGLVFEVSHVPRQTECRRAATPAPQSWSETLQALLLPLSSPRDKQGKRHGSLGSRKARENNSGSRCSHRGWNHQGSSTRGEAASQQPAEDTSPLQPKSQPTSPCCHSILQRRLLRKSDAGPRGLLGVVVQAADSAWRGREGSRTVLDNLSGCGAGWSGRL